MEMTMKSESPTNIAALLALEDGRTFPCRSFTGPGEASGEIVFNTGMTGYQEILSDPSYCGQMVAMTYPLIGNYGVNPAGHGVRPHPGGGHPGQRIPGRAQQSPRRRNAGRLAAPARCRWASRGWTPAR